jgi:two-component system, sensor histidine kinase FlrB
MTCLPSPIVAEPDPVLAAAAHSGNECDALFRDIGRQRSNLRADDEQFLLRAFRSFSEAAASLERSYGSLQLEVGRLRQELEASRAGLERSLEENRRIRARLDRILESLPCGVLVVSGKGEITDLNPEASRLLGLPARDSSSSLGLGELPAAARQLLECSRKLASEAESSSPDEHGRWLSARHAAVGEMERDSGSSVFILQDVSERKRLEQAEQKSRRDEALAEMSAVLAHEIRNPLGSLELFAGLLAESNPNVESRKWIGHIQAGLRTLAATVNNVLHFHSLPQPELSPLDLGGLVDWARDFLAPLAEQARVQLRSDHALDGVEIAADRHRLEQVLLNLVLNAIRATPEGGSIELSGRRRDHAVTIAITDTGPGISPQYAAKIFEPGFSTRVGSPGLGLAVCRKIVEQHGGSITAESRPGKGAAFTLQFHLAAESARGGAR